MKRLYIGLSPKGKIFGICLTGLLILAACSGSESAELNQALEARDVQDEESSLPPSLETDQASVFATEEISPIQTVEETGSDTLTEDGYPEPNDQSNEYPGPGESYPSPEDQVNGYPVPGEDNPPPDSQAGGYPDPVAGNPPPVKMGLQATNPSTVSLASGGIQLVEFFAFW